MAVDWSYVSDCRLAREVGAFWLSPDFYDDSPLAWPDANTETLRVVYEESRDRALKRYGEAAIARAVAEVAAHADLRELHKRSADPFQVVMDLGG
jgi:hypothetical protein